MKSKIVFNFEHGKIEGLYFASDKPDSPLVIITNGHNGFYNYGMFPYIQETLFANDISSYSYNFSHGGIAGDSDYFSELELYRKNCMRLETEDLYEIVRHLKESTIEFSERTKLVFLAHSLGGVPTIFAAKKLLADGVRIDGIILLSCVKTLEIWTESMMEEWRKDGVYFLKNNRTKQDLPQGKEFLEEVNQANGKWSVRKALREVNANFLIIHGEKDEAVPVEHSVTLNEWNREYGHSSELKIIPNATHTYNTKHPFESPSSEVNLIIKEIIGWMHNL